MSAHSFPSLTSDSSSIPSASSNLQDDEPPPLSSKGPEASPEIVLLREKASKLEQDKLVFGDYAAKLQSRIRNLEREKMENQDPINHYRDVDPRDKAQSHSTIVRPSPLQFSSTASQSRGSHHRASSSLSAVIAARRPHAHASPLAESPSPTPSQLAFPSSTSKLRLVPKFPKRDTRPPIPEASHSTILDESFSNALRQPLTNTSTPTRRRLQAMCGRLSLDATSQPPSSNDEEPSNHDINDYGPTPAYARTYNSMPSRRENGHHPETKRTTFTSKLDSVILTSKFFPLSSPRSKAPPVSVPRDHSHNGLTAVDPLKNPLSSSLRAGNVILDSPTKQHVKMKPARKGNPSLSRSLGLEENCQPDLQSKSEESKAKSRGRVSFSERIFSSSSGRGDETGTTDGAPGSLWGSWGRKKRPPPPSSLHKKEITATPLNNPSAAFSSLFAKSRVEGGSELEGKRYDSRHSLAAGCLKFVSGSNGRDQSSTVARRGSRVLRRSHSESRKSRSHLRSQSPPRDRVRHNYGSESPKNISTNAKEEKLRITPSRVGSPKPKGRVSDLQQVGTELERTSSLRSTGKWGQRGRAFTHEIPRRRTIHPMFSFERPGSAAASISSSRRADPDDEETVDRHRAGGTVLRAGAERSSRRTRCDARVEGSSHPTHVQDGSGTSGNTGLTLARSESVATQKGKGAMMRTRLGVQTHGTFTFEPAAAAVIPPRSAPPNSTFASIAGAGNRHLTTDCELVDGRNEGYFESARDRVYHDFCDDLKVVLGDGEEWASFTKYIRRYDVEVLTTDVLLRRVKKLIDGSPSVNEITKVKLYERFVNIVKDSVETKSV